MEKKEPGAKEYIAILIAIILILTAVAYAMGWF